MKKVFSLGLLIAAMTLIAFPSCKKDKKVTGVKLSETTKSIVVGGEFVLTATVEPTDALEKSVTWSSDKQAVATVDANGKVKGIAVGEATITVTTKDGSKTDKCKVTVTEKPIAVTGVTLSETEKMLKIGSEFTLTATVAPANATNKDVTWTSDKTDIATVENGKVKGIKEGVATITVTTKDGNKTATCKVTVFSTVQTDIFYFAYRGNLGVEGKHFYSLILLDKGMLSGGKIVKDGRGYYITICSDAPKSKTDFTPRMGNYKMAAQGQFEPMFIVRHDNFSFTGKIEDNKWGERSSFTEGELVLTANKITFKGKDADDGEYDLVFDGTYEVTNASPNPFKDEPEEKTTITKTWDKGEIKIGQVTGNKKTFTLQTGVDSERMATFVLFWENSTATKLEGTYNVTDTGEPKTVSKSRGLIDNSVYYSFYSKLTEDGYVDAPFYFFDKGTVTVTADKIEMKVESHFGSTLNLTYTGDITPKSAVAPNKARVYMSPMKKSAAKKLTVSSRLR